MKRSIAFLTLLVACLLLGACGGDEYCVTGTIAECAEDRVVVEVTRMTDENDTTDVSGTRVTFPLSETDVPPIDGAVVGDVVEVIYRGKLTPSDKGDLDALGFNLATKELKATLQAVEPDYLLVSPLESDPLAQEAEIIQVQIDGDAPLKIRGADKGDTLLIPYVRELVPGSPPQVEAIDGMIEVIG